MTEKFHLNSVQLLFHKDILLKIGIFAIGFILILVQNWISLSLILCPLILFGFSLFFQILFHNATITELKDSVILYSPFGEVKKISDIVLIFSYVELILVFFMGYDSLIHPQLIDNYFLLFLTPTIFLYEFGFFLVLNKSLNSAKIEIFLNNKNNNPIDKSSENNRFFLSFIKFNRFKTLSLLNIASFVIILALTLSLSYLSFLGLIPGLYFYHPGTGLEGSQPVVISFMLYIGIIFHPIFSGWIFYQIYKEIVNFSEESIERTTKNLPEDVKKKVLFNLSIYRS